MHAALGIDPGQTGAAVLLSGPADLAAVVAWRAENQGTGYRVRSLSVGEGIVRSVVCPGGPSGVGNYLGRIAATCEAEGVLPASGRILACEEVYVGKSPHAALRLAEQRIALLLGVAAYLPESPLGVTAGKWRAAVLPKLPKKRAEIKPAVIERMLDLLPGLRAACALLGSDSTEHVCEAAGIAIWASKRQ